MGRLPVSSDSSGYRRYTARHGIDLIRIRTLTDAGLPLARIRELRAAPDTGLRQALRNVDADLTARIRNPRRTQQRLRRLAAGDDDLLPTVSAPTSTGSASTGSANAG